MEQTIVSSLEKFFREQGFSDIAVEATDRAYTLTGFKGKTAAFLQLTAGHREKEQPATLAILSPVEQLPNDVIRPTLHVANLSR